MLRDRIIAFGRRALDAYGRHEIDMRSAAIAFYAAIAVVPVILFLLVAFGWLLRRQEVQAWLAELVTSSFGEQITTFLTNIFANVQESGGALAASLIGIAIAVYGTGNLFNQLRGAFFAIFDLGLREEGYIAGTVISYVLSLFYMISLILLLMILIGLHIVFSQILADASISVLESIAGSLVTLLLLTALFTLVYRAGSIGRADWSAAAFGAILVVPLIVLGNTALSYVLATSATLELYGAVGSAVAFMLWIYYLAKLVLLGAVCVRVYRVSDTAERIIKV